MIRRYGRLAGGLLIIGLILVSGGIMSLSLLRAERDAPDGAGIAELTARVTQLEQRLVEPTAELATEAAGDTGTVIPINQADQSLLEELPGIGPARAIAIIEERTRAGDFHDLADLDRRVTVIPASVLEGIAVKISFTE